MEKIGLVTNTGREGRAIQLDNKEWYSHYSEEAPCDKGDAVKVTYDDVTKGDKTYHNWIKVEITAKGEGKKNETKEMSKMNKRNNDTSAKVCALNNATTLCVARNEFENNQVLETATELLEFINN